MSFYAVAVGRNIGIYSTWNECEKQVKHFKNARYKKFKTKNEAEQFISLHSKNRPKSPDKSSIGTSNSESLMNKKVPMQSTSTNSYKNNGNKLQKNGIFAKEKCAHKTAKSKKIDFINGIRHNHLGDPIVYTDGACTANGKYNAKAGIGIFWSIDNPMNLSRRINGRQTNNRAEIEAAIVAIQIAKANGFKTLDIHTDSKFMITSMTEWLPKWKKNNWKLSTGETVKNKDDFMRLDAEISTMNRLIWTKVGGHSGDYGNDMADQLATSSIK